MSFRNQMRYMNPYDIHKALINEYILKKPGDTKYLRRDTSNDRTDGDVLRQNHRFLWDDDKAPATWEEQFAKKYYDKLFKEYCIGDLSLYKENKIALRWRVEKEVVTGKGQFTCGNKKCNVEDGLKSWEVNFSYIEQGEKKNALVKIRLCESCSKKLNYHSKKREVKRLKLKKPKNKLKDTEKERKDDDNRVDDVAGSSEETEDCNRGNNDDNEAQGSLWMNLKPEESKSREEEMEDYLNDLLL